MEFGGCGKTHFIKNLLEEWNRSANNDNDEEIIIKPIYITLNGVSSIKTVDYLIKKELSPFLYSEKVQKIKKIIFGTIKFTTKINLDFNNDGKEDGSISAELNLLDLLTSTNSKIKGSKLLIFDDIERCKIETDELLGYLNQFVEHNKCKIILVGDEDKIKELYDKINSKIHYKEFKEKLIGQTFSLQLDIDNALEEFIKDCTDEAKVIFNNHKVLIKDTFLATEINNLRLLRQCLLEFDRFIKNISKDLKSRNEYKEFIRQVLSYFIIVYCEYKSGNEEIKEFEPGYIKKDDAFDSNYLKYRILIKENKLQGFKYTIPLENIVEYIKESYIHPNDLKTIIIDSECFRKDTLKSWEKLWYYTNLENNEFLPLHREVKEQFMKMQVDTIPELLQIASILLSIQQDGLDSLKKETIIAKSKKNIDCIFKKYSSTLRIETKELLHASHGKGYLNRETKEFKEIFLYTEKKEKQKMLFLRDNRMKDYFENLTDDSLDTIFTVLDEGLPDRSGPYSMTPIFQNISVDKLAKRIVLLSNRSKYFFAEFIARRYYIEGSRYKGEIYKHHTDDLDTLMKVKNILEKKVKRLTLIDKMATNTIIQNLTSAINKLTELKDTAKES